MLTRIFLSAALLVLFGSATISAQDAKSDGQLNERVLGQIKKSLMKFEKELGEDKIAGVLKSVQAALDGKNLELKRMKLDPKKWLESVELGREAQIEALKKLKLLNDAENSGLEFGVDINDDRKMIGVLLENDDKLKIKDVVDGGPADQAGLKAGDRIIAINGKKIEELDALLKGVNESKGKVKIEVRRGDKEDLVVEVKPQAANPASKIIRRMIDLSKDGHQLDIENLKKGDIENLKKGDFSEMKLLPGIKTGPIKIEKFLTQPNKELAESVQQLQKQLKELQNQIKDLRKQKN